MDTATTWKDKRVLVTGADGFMGSHLTERLLDLEARVTVLVRGTSNSGTTQYKLKNISHVVDRLEDIIAVDIGAGDSIKLIKDNDPQTIFHLAAIAYVPYSFDRPREVHRSNVVGTLNVLDAAREIRGLERLVVTSSSEVYGTAEAEAEAIDEAHPMNPTSPYSASKVAADRYAYSYWRTYGLPIAIIRPFNYYGPRHIYDVIPKFIGMVLRGEPPTIYGTGEQSRDMTYVDDIVEAFLAMGSHERAVGEVVNFGTGRDVTIKEVAHKIIDISGVALEPVYLKERTAEVQRLCCDYSKARELFGWEPKVSIDEGLQRNIAWCKEHWL
ncbi:MAG: GDP-mannose 4,6-dehydratase [bacterium]|nr:GDP-mannose 4,6-dehydratase [bacterium]